MLYNLHFRIALLRVFEDESKKEHKFYTVAEIAALYLEAHPSTTSKAYQKKPFRQRVRNAFLSYEDLGEVERKENFDKTYKNTFYTFKKIIKDE